MVVTSIRTFEQPGVVMVLPAGLYFPGWPEIVKGFGPQPPDFNREFSIITP
jgi:hypothetical protein